MNAVRILYHMARADFLERARTSGFLFTLAFSIYAAHGFLPANGSAYVTLQIGGWRGLYNSAWVGASVALLASTFLSLVGFYLIKSAVNRDRVTRVGEILAATRLSKPVYTIGKTISNFLVLAAMTGVMALAAGLVQVLRAEDTHVHLMQLVAPFVLLTLPAMLLTSAIAVLFETLPPLSGGAGNIVYFFVWLMLLVGTGSIGDSFRRPTRDWLGRGAVMPDMVKALQVAAPDIDPDSVSTSMGLTFREGGWDMRTFRWDGPRWRPAVVSSRFVWVLIAFGIAMVAAVPFDRFDPSRGVRRDRGPPRARWAWRRPGRRAEAIPGPAARVASAAALPVAPRAGAAGVSAFLTFLGAEFRLALRGQGRWWWIVLLGMTVAALALPLEVARARVLPLLWVWPVLAWSPMGTRETRYRTDQLLFSAPHPIALQLAASWAAGVLLALAAGAALGARLALAGDGPGVCALAAGAAFIPALALALGSWTGTSRAFEAIYIVWWYTGPVQPIPPLDFMGASREAIEAGMPLVYGGAAVVLVLAAMLARAARMRR